MSKIPNIQVDKSYGTTLDKIIGVRFGVSTEKTNNNAE